MGMGVAFVVVLAFPQVALHLGGVRLAVEAAGLSSTSRMVRRLLEVGVAAGLLVVAVLVGGQSTGAMGSLVVVSGEAGLAACGLAVGMTLDGGVAVVAVLGRGVLLARLLGRPSRLIPSLLSGVAVVATMLGSVSACMVAGPAGVEGADAPPG